MTHYFQNDNNLKNNPRNLVYNYQDFNFNFQTNSGIFSKTMIDFGSRALLEEFLKSNPKGDVLDLGCGYGYLGIVINKITNNKVDMIDINERAIELAQLNNKNNFTDNQAWVSDGFSQINKKYKYIITNPPIRVGKRKMYSLLKQSRDFLQPDGELWLVIRQDQGAKTLIKDIKQEYLIEIVNKKKGFYIIKALIA